MLRLPCGERSVCAFLRLCKRLKFVKIAVETCSIKVLQHSKAPKLVECKRLLTQVCRSVMTVLAA